MSAVTESAPPPASPAPAPAALPERPSAKWGWLLLLAFVVAAALGYYYWQKPAGDPATVNIAKTATVQTGSVEHTLRVAGQTSARKFYNITAPILRGPEARGNLILIKLVKGGTMVRKGQLLAQIDAQSIVDHMDDVRDTIRQAENDVAKRQAEQAIEWESLQQTLRVAKSQWDKAKLEYSAAEVRTDVERELLKLTMEEAEARYKQQSKDLDTRKAVHAAEVAILKYTLERHKRHLQRHEVDLQRFTVYSPMDGLAVMQTTFRGGEMQQISEGDQVFPGQPFMRVVDQSTMQVEANVSQAQSSELRPGQTVRVGLDSFPGLILKGKIYSIGALAVGGWRQNYFIRNVPVRVSIETTDPRVIPDLSAYGDVMLEQASNVLNVPAAAINQEGEQSIVYVKSATGTWEKRPVTLGLVTPTRVAIQSGLKQGEEVRLQ